MRVLIKNGTVVNADGQAKQDLLIESGNISFNSAGELQPGERKLKLSVGLDGAEQSAVFTLPAPTDSSGEPCEFMLDAPRTLSAGTPTTRAPSSTA